jgi:hypothetical protein
MIPMNLAGPLVLSTLLLAILPQAALAQTEPAPLPNPDRVEGGLPVPSPLLPRP